jgi:hypothetical protein
VKDFSHRDRRAHREVNRALWATTGITLGLIVIALVIPYTVVGLSAVVALGVVGVAYIAWGERLLDRYTSDLRDAREGILADGFVRAEMASPVGLNRDARSPASLSPHSRRRSRATDTEPPRTGGGAGGNGQA